MKKNELVIEFLSTLNCFKPIENVNYTILLHIPSSTMVRCFSDDSEGISEDMIFLRNDSDYGWMPVKYDTVVDIYIAEHLELEKIKEDVKFKRLKNEFDIKMGKYKKML